jgi:ABC-type uncharacterized transport system fused permease/ATPase subunit
MSIFNTLWGRLSKKSLVLAALPLLLVIVVEIATTSLIPYARKIVIDSLTAMDWKFFLLSAGFAFGNSLALIGAQGMKEWLGQRLAFIVREMLIKVVKKPWIAAGAKSGVSNECARLNDDSKVATEGAIRVSIEVLISVCIVLALLTTILKWPLLFFAAIIYSGLSVTVAMLFRSPMINSQYSLSDAESQHRLSLTLIANQAGDFTSKAKWEVVKGAYTRFINVCRNYKMFNALQSAAMYTIPFLIMAPAYFRKELTLGEVMQGTLTFDLLVLNATIWVTLYPPIMAAQTAWIRLKEMYDAVQQKRIVNDDRE